MKLIIATLVLFGISSAVLGRNFYVIDYLKEQVFVSVKTKENKLSLVLLEPKPSKAYSGKEVMLPGGGVLSTESNDIVSLEVQGENKNTLMKVIRNPNVGQKSKYEFKISNYFQNRVSVHFSAGHGNKKEKATLDLDPGKTLEVYTTSGEITTLNVYDEKTGDGMIFFYEKE